ncbi:unnamed protein product [Polarella glacialis]|uniref:Uncharacterized protein n=1 Tax=Polarella glacialis TaxID=89957 RepID=A0A813JDA8_POLGL|nr:unnamed protein product [Polarella glacialis]
MFNRRPHPPSPGTAKSVVYSAQTFPRDPNAQNPQSHGKRSQHPLQEEPDVRQEKAQDLIVKRGAEAAQGKPSSCDRGLFSPDLASCVLPTGQKRLETFNACGEETHRASTDSESAGGEFSPATQHAGSRGVPNEGASYSDTKN